MKYNLSDILVKGMGKEDCEALAEEANKDESLYCELLDIVEQGERTPAMKASWVLGRAGRQSTVFPEKYHKRIIGLLQASANESVRRELLKAVEEVHLPEAEEGNFIDQCFAMLIHPTSDLAVRYYCIKRLSAALRRYPELKHELKSSLESLTEYHTDAWKRYLQRTIVKIDKMKERK